MHAKLAPSFAVTAFHFLFRAQVDNNCALQMHLSCTFHFVLRAATQQLRINVFIGTTQNNPRHTKGMQWSLFL